MGLWVAASGEINNRLRRSTGSWSLDCYLFHGHVSSALAHASENFNSRRPGAAITAPSHSKLPELKWRHKLCPDEHRGLFS